MGRVYADKLKPGMILETDVYNISDQLILPEGLELNEKAIDKLHQYGIEAVRIKEDVAGASVDVHMENSYGERLRATPEFKKYKEEFEKTVNEMSQMFSDVVVRNAPLKSDKLVDSVFELLNPERGSVNLFDMLHNMRTYDDLTFAHSLNVGLICNVFAGWLHMSEEEKRIATECGILHDIGKLKIPNDIIRKPTKLTDEEYEIVKNHTTEGYKILQKHGVSEPVRRSALMHHERCDGAGYPLGLVDNQIDKFAKIVAIADVYEAMTSSRSYRGCRCPFTVIEAFEEEGLQKYDTRMIMTFLEKIVNTYMLNRVGLSNNMEGDIIFINKQRLSRPVVKCGNEYIDLSKEKNIKIEKLL